MTRASRTWLKILLTGLLLWVLTVAVTFFASNTNLLPTVILLGSFLVPVTFVAWAFERPGTHNVSISLILSAFVIGGVLGVLGASVLETYLLRPSIWLYLGVGLIEEGVKAAALIWIARRVPKKTTGAGLLLGAAVGFGFAAFESSGYAMTAMFTDRGLSLAQLVETEILRGLLAPFGHGLWTAILGGVLFSESVRGKIRITVRVIGAYLGVSLLHGLWDSMTGIAVVLTYVFTGSPRQRMIFEHGYLPRATDAQVHIYTVLQWGGWIILTAIALAWLAALVRGEKRSSVARSIGREHGAASQENASGEDPKITSHTEAPPESPRDPRQDY